MLVKVQPLLPEGMHLGSQRLTANLSTDALRYDASNLFYYTYSYHHDVLTSPLSCCELPKSGAQ